MGPIKSLVAVRMASCEGVQLLAVLAIAARGMATIGSRSTVFLMMMASMAVGAGSPAGRFVVSEAHLSGLDRKSESKVVEVSLADFGGRDVTSRPGQGAALIGDLDGFLSQNKLLKFVSEGECLDVRCTDASGRTEHIFGRGIIHFIGGGDIEVKG